jgi:hypothetical protein
MKPKFRPILEMALEQGVRYGYNRAFRHDPAPHVDAIVEHIVEQVINSLDDWFDFEENNEPN